MIVPTVVRWRIEELNEQAGTIFKLNRNRLVGAFHEKPTIRRRVSQEISERGLGEKSSANALMQLVFRGELT
jgi:hypothetical protein